jgi:hypothetical protein
MTPVQEIPDTIKAAAMQPTAAGRKAKARMSSSPEWNGAAEHGVKVYRLARGPRAWITF